MVLRALVLFLLAMPPTVSAGHGTGAPPANVLVARGRTEPSIAIDPFSTMYGASESGKLTVSQ